MKPGRLQTPIFVYDDAVDYVHEWCAYARRFGVTHKDVVRKAGFGAHAIVSDVVARRKKIGARHIDGFVTALELTGDAAEYFRLLVERDVERDSEKKAAHFRRLGELREKNVTRIVADRSMEYFASWRYPVIREYVLYKGLVRSPREVVDALVHLKLGSRDVETALKKLEKWDLVYYDKGAGGWRPRTDEGTVAYTQMPHSVVNDVKRTMIEASVHAMETLDKGERHASMALRGISEKQYRELCGKIDQLRKELLEMGNDGKVDRVACFNAQVFPIVWIGKDGNSEEAHQ